VEQPWRLIVAQRTHRVVLQAIPESRSLAQSLGRDVRSSSTGPASSHRTSAIERRRGQRRAEPSVVWYTHGFILIDTAELLIEAIRLNNTSA
jgi:hypothetical protein